MALRDYLRQYFLTVWLPKNQETFKEHMLKTRYYFANAS
jgi:hypothetical protein